MELQILSAIFVKIFGFQVLDGAWHDFSSSMDYQSALSEEVCIFVKELFLVSTKELQLMESACIVILNANSCTQS